MPDHSSYELASCKHVFHTECIMQWFRSGNGSCPMCRDEPLSLTQQVRRAYSSKLSTFETSAFRQYCKKPKANKMVMRMFQRYLTLDKQWKERKKAYKEFNAQNKETIKMWRKLRNSVWSSRCRMRNAVDALRRVPVVPFIVPIHRNQRRARSSAPAPAEAASSSAVEPVLPSVPDLLEETLDDDDTSSENSDDNTNSVLAEESDLSTSEDEEDDN